MHVLSLLQNKFGLVFFRLFDGALETSNFRFEEARSAITLLRCFLHENTQRGKIARIKFAEELGTMSKNRLRWITLVRGPIWGIHSLTLMISWFSEVVVVPQLRVLLAFEIIQRKTPAPTVHSNGFHQFLVTGITTLKSQQIWAFYVVVWAIPANEFTKMWNEQYQAWRTIGLARGHHIYTLLRSLSSGTS